MNIRKMTIGQMAKLNNVTSETLRFYDREGLLVPLYIDNETGYRYYHINQSARLDMIQYLQSQGLSLGQIREYLESYDSETLYKLLSEHLQLIDREIKQIQQNRKSIIRMLENHKRYKNLPGKNTLFYEYIEQRSIFVHKTKRNYFEQDDTGYELMLRELKQGLLDNNMPVSYFTHAGTIIRSEHLTKSVLHSDEVFCFVESDFKEAKQIEVLPTGLFLCVCNDNFLKEAESVQLLTEKVKEDGYAIAGDYICEVVEEFPRFDSYPRKLIYKAQIPVKKSS